MDDIESQIAKIELGGGRRAGNYVYVMAEKAALSAAELYLVAELPVLNPAAEESCEKICLAIAGTLRRAYKKPLSADVFELAISQINEELGKLAGLGQTHWIDKLNCIIAVKDKGNFTVASCGKVAAYLLRGGELTDISCSPEKSHPLKTFENYASGKIRLADLIILSTTQLFNYISMDRAKTILSGHNFLAAAQTIIQLLKDNAGPEVAFGTILNLQIPAGQASMDEINLEDYIAEQPKTQTIWSKVITYVTGAIGWDKTKRVPKVSLPKFTNLGASTKSLARHGANAMRSFGATVSAGRKSFSVASFNQLSRLKKALLAAAVFLLIVLIVNIYILEHYKKVKQVAAVTSSQLSIVQNLLNNAESSLLYKDNQTAQADITQAMQQLPSAQNVAAADKAAYQKITDQLNTLEQQTEKATAARVTNLGTLAQADGLISLPNIYGTQINGTILSYDQSTGQIDDGVLKCLDTIVASAFLKNTTAVIYNGTNLELWDFGTGQLSGLFSGSVPARSDFVDIKLYSVNSRVYTINKKTNQIISFATSGNKIDGPLVNNKDQADLSKAQDFAIDGNIYILTDTGIVKFTAGRLQPFAMPFLFHPYSGSGKIYTDVNSKNIYILDKAGKRIIIMDKKGNLVETLTSDQFSNLEDFSVNEVAKTMYVLNGSSLLKVSF